MLMPSIFNDNVFDDFFEFPFYDDKAERKLYGHRAANLMKTDIQEHDDGYTLEMDLPGFKKEEIQIELNNGYMTISAAKGLDLVRAACCQNDICTVIDRHKIGNALHQRFLFPHQM